MKVKINPYIKSLLRENSAYIILNIVLVVVLIVFSIYNFHLIPDKQNDIARKEGEITELQKRLNVLNSPFATNDKELNSSLELLNSLIPSSEDYFSIISVLEELSSKTNFIIDSYVINLASSNTNKLQLTIDGKGDQESFIKFLKEYNFGGGRLITSSNIKLSSKFAGSMVLTITFYNKPLAPGTQLPLSLSNEDQAEIEELKNKVSFTIKEEKTEDSSYSKKSNPF